MKNCIKMARNKCSIWT